jgi:hypothetical protein
LRNIIFGHPHTGACNWKQARFHSKYRHIPGFRFTNDKTLLSLSLTSTFPTKNSAKEKTMTVSLGKSQPRLTEYWHWLNSSVKISGKSYIEWKISMCKNCVLETKRNALYKLRSLLLVAVKTILSLTAFLLVSKPVFKVIDLAVCLSLLNTVSWMNTILK